MQKTRTPLILAAVLGASLLSTAMHAQQVGPPFFPQTLPSNTVVGRIAPGTGPATAIPFASVGSGLLNSGSIIPNLPVVGGATSGFTQGTRSGNTTVFATSNGVFTSGDCVKFDSNGNLVDAGGGCFNGPFTGSGQNFYVSTSGNDANDCLAATVTGGHGPCLTVAQAVAVASEYDAHGQSVAVNLGSGTFNQGFLFAGFLRGGANGGVFSVPLIISGAGSGSTTLDDNTSNCGTIIATGPNTQIQITALKIQKTSGCGGNGAALFIQNQASATILSDVVFGAAGAAHIEMEQLAQIESDIGYTIAGNANAHLDISTLSHFGYGGQTITCTGGVTAFSDAFAHAETGAWITLANGTSFSGCGSVTGKRIEALNGGHIDYNGNTSLTAFPGNSFGVVDTVSTYTPEPTTSTGTCTNGSIDNNSVIADTKVNFSGNNTSCAINFPYNLVNNPVCVASSQGGTVSGVTSLNTGVTVTGTFANSTNLQVICRPLHW